MTQLVIGASGLVGSHLLRTLIHSKQQVSATYRNNPIDNAHLLEITQADDVNSLLNEINPKIVYLPASLTNVDFCELHPQETYLINVRGVQTVVRACNEVHAKLVYFSSDYIFDGKDGPYDEEVPANPISEYGRQKLAAEHYIALFANQYVIIRTTVVYGWEAQEKNFIYRMVKSLKENTPVRAPADQVGTPTFVNNLAEISIQVAMSAFTGVLNISGPDCINRFEFAQAAADIFGLEKQMILPVSTADLNQPAKRPLQAGLKSDKIARLSSIPPISYYDGLKTMAIHLKSETGKS